MINAMHELSPDTFQRDGYLVVRRLVDPVGVGEMRETVLRALDPLQGPAEFETDVGYPGSPASRDAAGGNTPRRLLHAYSRGPVFHRWSTAPELASTLRAVMRGERIEMSQCHHNCVMTKHPGFSSETAWHQDIRYWSFDAPELVSVWLALGREHEQNGALRVIPGSHRLDLDRGRFDRHLFLRPELDENRGADRHRDAGRARSGRCAVVPLPAVPRGGQESLRGRQALRGVHLPHRGQSPHPGHPLRSISVGASLIRPQGVQPGRAWTIPRHLRSSD